MAIPRIYLRLVTACGCERLIENPLLRLPPYRYVVPLMQRPKFVCEAATLDEVPAPPRREFELRKESRLDENTWVYTYEEVVE